jgi:tRNA A-37 threonylcarbamoyl transferase component Bud32/uncharacterized RDD family membrane protein YckC
MRPWLAYTRGSVAKSEQSRRLALAETLAGVGLDDLEATESRAAPPLDDALAGTRLDHFVLEEPLGRGGMGAVYVARDTSLDRRVAIKMLREDLGRALQEKRLLLEARTQARLNHPNVAHIYFIGRRPGSSPEEPGPLYLAMELVDGESLDAVLERGGRMDPEEARQAMLQVARGLRAARRAGIVHRDIKPSNLILDGEGVIKVVDFGLAQPVEGGMAAVAEEGIAGSPLYMAPEQVRGDAVDHRSDMYALGAAFFHLLSGRPPFEGQSAVDLLSQHLTAPPPRLRQVAPHVPRPLTSVVDRLLRKDAAQRFEDYDRLIEALEEAAPAQTTFAGFWIRAAGTGIDLLLAGVFVAVLGWFGGVLHLLHVTVGHAYGGQTLAKYLLRIQVRQPDASPLGLWKSAVRTTMSLWMPLSVAVTILVSQGLVELQSVIEQLRPSQMGELQSFVVAMAVGHGLLSLLYGGGLVLAAFHPQKRALHDLVVGSVVLYQLAPQPMPVIGRANYTGGGP